MNFYFNNKGEKVEIADMPDAYLLNSYAKQKKILSSIEDKLKVNPGARHLVQLRVTELKEIIQSLKAECEKRALF